MFYVGPIAQLLFWAALAIAAIWAVLLLRKFVALKAIEVGVDTVAADTLADDDKAGKAKADSKDKPNVDEFVE